MNVNRRPIQVFSLSFLDVISCGFGAIILLLVLSLALEPATQERMATDLNEKIKQIESEREALIASTKTLRKEVTENEEELTQQREVLEQLEKDAEKGKGERAATAQKAEEQSREEQELESVLETLSEEVKRLQSSPSQLLADKSVIGGIPVDSEYIVFVIDTSGSMQAVWPSVVKKVEEVLSVHPRVKGIQVVNDMGRYMFSGYAGKWIQDTPARRREFIRRLRGWKSFSNSSPVEGIQHVVRTYSRKQDPVSVYVFGDDFSGGNIDDVLREVVKSTRKELSGKGPVRIHTFGFPMLFSESLASESRISPGKSLPESAYMRNRVRFSHLMRLLAEKNNGTFVGLSDYDAIYRLRK